MKNLIIKYRHIIACGKFMGSSPYYIEDQIKKAELTNASETAIFFRKNEGWHTYEGINSSETKRMIDKYLKEI